MKIVNKPNNGLKGFPILSKLEAKALTAKVATISSLSSLVLALAAFSVGRRSSCIQRLFGVD